MKHILFDLLESPSELLDNEDYIRLSFYNATKICNSKLVNLTVHKFKPQGILIPGGFGNRGIEGMINMAKYARTKQIPYFGICLGMQIAVIEFARNVLKIKADSTEFNKKTPNPVIALITEWMDEDGLVHMRSENSEKGGTMRLGLYDAIIKNNSLISMSYL